MKKSPIYLFYEKVANGPDGTPGDDGDVHYHCLHGSHKVYTIKRSIKSNVNGESYCDELCSPLSRDRGTSHVTSKTTRLSHDHGNPHDLSCDL